MYRQWKRGVKLPQYLGVKPCAAGAEVQGLGLGIQGKTCDLVSIRKSE